MEIIETRFRGLYILKPVIHQDHRGLFMESFRAEWFRGTDIPAVFVQDNESMSARHVLRGLHFQNPPHEQGKLIRVIRGAVLDVCVDIRRGSQTYGQYFSINLNGSDRYMIYVPPGFAHGFLSLENDSVLNYKCTDYFHKNSEGCLRWNDPLIGIKWGIDDPTISEKDNNAPLLNELKSQFKI